MKNKDPEVLSGKDYFQVNNRINNAGVDKDDRHSPIEDNTWKEDHLEIFPHNERCFDNGLIGFTHFPMRVEILMEVLNVDQLGIREVKELTCWKYLILFENKDRFNSFRWNLVKDWLAETRLPSSEDLIVKRKMAIEAKGIPMDGWSDENLQLITKDIGSWGWWINCPVNGHKLENPKLSIYTSMLDKVKLNLKILIKGVRYRVKLVEVPFVFAEDSDGIVSQKKSLPQKDLSSK